MTLSKIFVLMIAAAFLFYAGNTNAVVAKYAKDSTALAQQAVLTSDISAPDIPVELGLIIPWNSVTNPPTFSPGGKFPKWADCDGRSIAGSDLCAERGICSTPNFKDKFLRASTDRIGQNFLDSLRSHNHEQPGHVHQVDTNLTSTAVTANVDNTDTAGTVSDVSVSGTAAGQQVNIPGHNHSLNTSTGIALPSGAGAIWGSMTVVTGVSIGSASWGGGGGTSVTAQSSNVTAKLNNNGVKGKLLNSKVSGNVVNDHASGEAHMSGDDPTYYTYMEGSKTFSSKSMHSNTETAPEHQRVRYLMRINR